MGTHLLAVVRPHSVARPALPHSTICRLRGPIAPWMLGGKTVPLLGLCKWRWRAGSEPGSHFVVDYSAGELLTMAAFGGGATLLVGAPRSGRLMGPAKQGA